MKRRSDNAAPPFLPLETEILAAEFSHASVRMMEDETFVLVLFEPADQFFPSPSHGNRHAAVLHKPMPVKAVLVLLNLRTDQLVGAILEPAFGENASRCQRSAGSVSETLIHPGQ